MPLQQIAIQWRGERERERSRPVDRHCREVEVERLGEGGESDGGRVRDNCCEGGDTVLLSRVDRVVCSSLKLAL